MELVKLSDLIVQSEQVEVQPGKAIEVFPLSLDAIVNLFWTYQDTFVTLYSEGSQEKPNFASIVIAAPDMVAEIIAYGAHAKEEIHLIKNLPGTVQLIALSKIWKLSVPDPKKLTEALTEALGGLQKAQETVKVTPPKLDSKTETSSSIQ